MPNTYTQLYIHFVFATETRYGMIRRDIQDELNTYIAGIIKDMGCFLQCIGGMEDHIHILVGLNPTMSASELVQQVKAGSSKFINKKGWIAGRFNWQEGFGAFSVSQSQLEQVRHYINNQEEHHRGQSFTAEYETLLQRYKVDYDKQYIFH